VETGAVNLNINKYVCDDMKYYRGKNEMAAEGTKRGKKGLRFFALFVAKRGNGLPVVSLDFG
jgi:hypothetical protein